MATKKALAPVWTLLKKKVRWVAVLEDRGDWQGEFYTRAELTSELNGSLYNVFVIKLTKEKK